MVAAMTVPALPVRQELAWSELTERLERAALAGSGQELRAVRIDLLRQLMRPRGTGTRAITIGVRDRLRRVAVE